MAEHRDRPPARVLWGRVTALGVAQTLGWGSTYYLPAILATPMAESLGVSTVWTFGGLTLALFVSAAMGPLAGRWIDRWGGRPVLMATNLGFALGLVLLATAHTLAQLALAWGVIGLAMGAGLYDAAFAGLVRWLGPQARGPITGVTLIAGFASTVSWPLSTWMVAHGDWRMACLTWAALHLLVGLPLNACLPKAVHRGPRTLAADEATPTPPAGPHAPPSSQRWTMVALSGVFAVAWFNSTAMAAHLPQLMVSAGLSLTAAVAVGTLIGPAQVLARLTEFGLLRRLHPLTTSRWATLTHPVAAGLLMLGGPAMAAPFALIHGAGNGILTIAKGTLPLALFGPHGYGQRQGWLMVPARLAQALAPLAFGAALSAWGQHALWLTAVLGVVAFGALLGLRATPQPR